MKTSPSGPELLSLRIKREPGPPGTSRSSSGHPSHDILLLKRRGGGLLENMNIILYSQGQMRQLIFVFTSRQWLPVVCINLAME